MLERLRGKVVSIDSRKCRTDVDTNTNLSHFAIVVQLENILSERDSDMRTTNVSEETHVWAGMFAKAPKLEPYFIP